MNINLEIKKILLEKNIDITTLNNMLNNKNNTNLSVQNLAKKLRSNSMKFNEAVEILNILDYEIMIKER